MYISEILKIEKVDDETVYVKAVAEDFILTRPQTYEDPAEYGPATVYAFFDSLDISNYEGFCGMKIPTEYFIDSVKEYLEAIDYDLNWEKVEDDY
jgi:hypothetical protein